MKHSKKRSTKRCSKKKSAAQLVGSRRQVWNGTAAKTGYGKHALKKCDLKLNVRGRIVSKRASAVAKRNKNLGDHQQLRGSHVFGSRVSCKRSKKRSRSRSRKR